MTIPWARIWWLAASRRAWVPWSRGGNVPGGNAAEAGIRGLIRRLREEHARNTSVAWRAATAAWGLSREDLVEFVEENPRGVPMYLLILHAAGTNGYEETLRAMGAVFGAAASSAKLGNVSEVARADAALRAMSDLTPHHFRALKHFLDHPPEPTADSSLNYRDSTHEAVAVALDVPVGDAAQYLLNLARAGLVTMIGLTDGHTGHEATVVGRAVSDAARWVGAS